MKRIVVLVFLLLFPALSEAYGDFSSQASGVTLDKLSLTIGVGETEKLVATAVSVNTKNKNVMWGSSNTAIATVNDGYVTGISPGTADIIVVTEDAQFTSTCTVVVMDPALMDISKYAEGEVLVVLSAPKYTHPENGPITDVYSKIISSHAKTFTSKFGLEACNTYPEIAKFSSKSIIHVRSEHKSTKQLINELSSDPNVECVSPNYIRKIANWTPDDPDYFEQWGMDNIGMPAVWDYI